VTWYKREHLVVGP